MGGARTMNAALAGRAQKMRDSGTPVKVIAEKFGVTGQTIRNWTNAPGRKAPEPFEAPATVVVRKPALVIRHQPELGRLETAALNGLMKARARSAA